MAQALPPDEGDAVARHLREYDRLSEDLKVVERELARDARTDPNVTRLMTIPGIDMMVAVGLIAAIGPVARFAERRCLGHPACLVPGCGVAGSA